ncbi:MAG: hypothetical protein CO094_00950 [Anaerolineae bacterium CG_4_9_14_3_um_filter_57_17]|nr:response regulator [bacterium]NCT21855.1 response regulator [bacterium]OIO86084.1 MAG: hypothetical protein AUK01_04445 [Anaerolineae bacterium CG2_30_57_67]PJB68502.1 MAG: hypothetical protein CO094_00950 [Anaerolineae bacterium CG_4_9_14_3_um_filter_57_17]
MTNIILRALVVDDDASWQQILSELLTDCGLTVETTATLENAIISLRAQPHRLAVIDLSLAPNDHNNTDGLRALEAVHQLDPNCQAILLTGFATVEVAVAALTDYGAVTFLRKESFQRQRFRETIHHILASPPRLTAASARKNQVSATKALKRALVVEDDAGWRSILEELLGEAEFAVRACASFGEALAALRREKFSLAVIDLSLQGKLNSHPEKISASPEPQSYPLLASNYTAGIPTIVVSGIANAEEIQAIYSKYSIFAYLEKQTFNRATFRRIVEETRGAQTSDNKINTLTGRESEVFNLLAQGLTNKEIAEKLVITPNTVKRHLKAIFSKMDVHTRSAATAKASAGNL